MAAARSRLAICSIISILPAPLALQSAPWPSSKASPTKPPTAPHGAIAQPGAASRLTAPPRPKAGCNANLDIR